MAETLRATDFVGARLFDENAHIVWDLAEVGVPKFAQRSLVSFGFRVAAGIVRQNARPHGFEA